MDAQFFTAVEIAKILKVSRALSYRLIAQGEIASVRFGRTVRVKQADLEEFVNRHTTDGGTNPEPASQTRVDEHKGLAKRGA